MKDLAHLEQKLAEFKEGGGEASIETLSATQSLLALQGPTAESILSQICKLDLTAVKFMTSAYTEVCPNVNSRSMAFLV